jgi:membrane protein implicated in regulation of membrane protease activity
MSYGVEWIPGGVVFGAVLLLLIVPEFAAIAVLVITLAAFVALVALAAAAVASPYLLTRALRRRLAKRNQPPTAGSARWIHQHIDTRPTHSPNAIGSRPDG